MKKKARTKTLFIGDDGGPRRQLSLGAPAPAPAPATLPALAGKTGEILRNAAASVIAAEIADQIVNGPPPAPVAWACAHNALGAKWRELAAGTACIVTRDNGTLLETWTRGTPRDLGGQPVVDCEGISGPYHLRCVFLRVKG